MSDLTTIAPPKTLLMHGDAIEMMKQIPDRSISAIIMDPPYCTTECHWDQQPLDLMALWEEGNRIVKDDRSPIVIFSAQPFTIQLNYSNHKNWRHEWHWVKNNAPAVTCKTQPLRYTECISVFSGAKAPIYHPPREKYDVPVREYRQKFVKSKLHGGGIHVNETPEIIRTHKTPRNLLHYPIVSRAERFMNTQKPLELMKFLIETYSDPGDIVLDATMGSGTTGLAAVQLGRDFVGIEKDHDHFQIASARIHGLPIERKQVPKVIEYHYADEKLMEAVAVNYATLLDMSSVMKIGEVHQMFVANTNVDCKFTAFRNRFYSIARQRGDYERFFSGEA